jgi:hypothetical protein
MSLKVKGHQSDRVDLGVFLIMLSLAAYLFSKAVAEVISVVAPHGFIH